MSGKPADATDRAAAGFAIKAVGFVFVVANRKAKS